MFMLFDICGIVDHHCYNFHFIIISPIYIYIYIYMEGINMLNILSFL